MTRRSPEALSAPEDLRQEAIPQPEAEEPVELKLRKKKAPKKPSPEEEARFKEGLSKLREREERRKKEKREEEIIEETRADLKRRYEARKQEKAETEEEEVSKATEEFRKKMEARSRPQEAPPAVPAEPAPEEALEEPEILGEISEEEARKIESAAARRYQQEIADDLKLMQIDAEWSEIQNAAAEAAKARELAEKIFGQEQASELDQDPVARSFFAAGENPIILAQRETLQKEIDMAAEVNGYAVDFEDWDQSLRDLRSVEEGGKIEPLKMETAEERARAVYAFESRLRQTRLEAIDRAHQEFPDSFTFTAKEYERLTEKASLLRNRVAQAKKERSFFAKVRGVFEGPSVQEREYRALKRMLDEWDEKIADFVDAGKSQLAAKFMAELRADLDARDKKVRQLVR